MNGFSANDIEPNNTSCRGFCDECNCYHHLPFGNALGYAETLMAEFVKLQRLDYLVSESQAQPLYNFKNILPGDRGHMFGVLECLNPATNQTIWLRAFSSLGGGIRVIDGWVPYLISEDQFNSLILPVQQEIKRLTSECNSLSGDSDKRKRIEQSRAQLSRDLMPKIHDLYQITNFRGQTRPIRDFFPSDKIPGGVGDCCAPKLLNSAIAKGLHPISIAEFFWGGSNNSGRKQPGNFFPACADKCQPILGFMLCGSDFQKNI